MFTLSRLRHGSGIRKERSSVASLMLNAMDGDDTPGSSARSQIAYPSGPDDVSAGGGCVDPVEGFLRESRQEATPRVPSLGDGDFHRSVHGLGDDDRWGLPLVAVTGGHAARWVVEVMMISYSCEVDRPRAVWRRW